MIRLDQTLIAKGKDSFHPGLFWGVRRGVMRTLAPEHYRCLECQAFSVDCLRTQQEPPRHQFDTASASSIIHHDIPSLQQRARNLGRYSTYILSNLANHIRQDEASRRGNASMVLVSSSSNPSSLSKLSI